MKSENMKKIAKMILAGEMNALFPRLEIIKQSPRCIKQKTKCGVETWIFKFRNRKYRFDYSTDYESILNFENLDTNLVFFAYEFPLSLNDD